jgi:hypothetical protein
VAAITRTIAVTQATDREPALQRDNRYGMSGEVEPPVRLIGALSLRVDAAVPDA